MHDDYTTHRNVDGTWRLSVKRLDDTGYVEVSTHDTQAEALQGMVDAIVEEKRVAQSNLDRARARQDATERQLNELQSLIEGLPWNDINSGDFHPQQGCGDVAMFRDSAIGLGCDSDILCDGAEREYTVNATVTLNVSIVVTSTSEEDAETQLDIMLDNTSWTADKEPREMGLCVDDYEHEIKEVEAC
jgi:hypothetical protein